MFTFGAQKLRLNCEMIERQKRGMQPPLTFVSLVGHVDEMDCPLSCICADNLVVRSNIANACSYLWEFDQVLLECKGVWIIKIARKCKFK